MTYIKFPLASTVHLLCNILRIWHPSAAFTNQNSVINELFKIDKFVLKFNVEFSKDYKYKCKNFFPYIMMKYNFQLCNNQKAHHGYFVSNADHSKVSKSTLSQKLFSDDYVTTDFVEFD